MTVSALSELRLMSSRSYDSNSILTVILCGDERLTQKMRMTELVPLGSRIRVRHKTEHYNKEKFAEILKELMRSAGNASFMSEQLISLLAEKSMGNYRAMIQMANTLLSEGIRLELSQIDEKLFFEFFDPTRKTR